MPFKSTRNAGLKQPVSWIVCVGALAACNGSDSHGTSLSQQALVAECAKTDQVLDGGAWLCPDKRTVECTSGDAIVNVDTIYFRETDGTSCNGQPLGLSNAGPFGVGDHQIDIKGADGTTICSAELDVVDTHAPTLEAKAPIFLWPPNHKFHAISVNDCVTVSDACQNNLQAQFLWASSDEPVDSLGDGHTGPDIQLGSDCSTVELRAERQGPKNGRVYKLGVRVVDGSGNAADSVCTVIVDHDQRGVDGADSGESYRVQFDGKNGAPLCDGKNALPPAPPVNPVSPSGGDGTGNPPSSGTPDAGTGSTTPGTGSSQPPAAHDAGTPNLL